MANPNLVYYSQEDPRWRHTMFSNHGDRSQTIGTSACGPTSAAMAISSLTGKQVLPTDTSRYAVAKGYRTYNDGTAWGFFASVAKEYGVECKQRGSLDEVKAALKAGALVVASMGPGHVTGGGHYILLVGISSKWIDVFDPNHDNTKYGNDGLIQQGIKDDGRIKVEESVFRKEARQYWVFTTKEEKYKMSPEDANKIIALLGAVWQVTDTPEATNEGQKEAGRLANEIRKASGQPTT